MCCGEKLGSAISGAKDFINKKTNPEDIYDMEDVADEPSVECDLTPVEEAVKVAEEVTETVVNATEEVAETVAEEVKEVVEEVKEAVVEDTAENKTE